jgi:biopolymer transport protein ExbB
VLELIFAGGWLMIPIITCSIVSLAIIGERFWTLNTKKIIPLQLVPQVWNLYKDNQLDNAHIRTLRENSPLGQILAAGLVNREHGREVMKEGIEEAGRQVVHQLEKFMNSLGTIASITPLLGLLGTVIGMIKVFTAIVAGGVGNPAVLAGGISEALLTTAAGLTVAIPSLMFHRFFQGRINELVLKMEDEALKLIEVMHGERESDDGALK